MLKRIKLLIATIVSAFVLTACGGGAEEASNKKDRLVKMESRSRLR